MLDALETVYCKRCECDQPISSDGRCAVCYRNYQREYRQGKRERCSGCNRLFVRRNRRQGKRCRSCINRKQNADIKKRKDEPVEGLTRRLLSNPWTEAGLSENWG